MASKKKGKSVKPTAKAVKNTRATSKQLQSLAKALATSKRRVSASRQKTPKKSDAVISKKVVKELKKDSKQVKKTIKEVSKLAHTLRDAFGRFTSSNKKTSQKKQPKKSPVKSSKPTSRSHSKSIPQPSPKTQAKKSKQQKTSTSSGKSKASSKKSSSKKPPVKKAIPKAPKKQAKKKVFSERGLKPRSGESLVDFYDRLESDSDGYDEKLGDGEYYVFTYANGKSRRVYRNISLAIQQMRRYDLSKQIIDREDEGSEIEGDLLESISFTKFHGTPLEYVLPNEERIRQRAAERQQIRRHAKKVLGVSSRDFGANIDLVEQLTKALEIERNKNANGGRNKEKGLSKSNGSKKKPSKRTSSKTTVSKTRKN